MLVMTVEASSRYGRFLHQGGFFERMNVTLVDADVSAHFIARLDTAIGQTEIVQRIGTDEYLKVLVCLPFPFFPFGSYLDVEASSSVGFCQFVPILYVEVGPLVLYVQLTSLTPGNLDIHLLDYRKRLPNCT